jgi:cell division inhibitor SulA
VSACYGENSEMSSFQQQLFSEPLNENCNTSIISRIVEFVVPEVSLQQLAFIFPLLGHLSHSEDPRWLTCIGTVLLSKKDCRLFGLNRYRLLQVLPSQRCNVVDITERALAAGKCHTVFCQTNIISKQALTRLEQAAEYGQARCVIARSR